MSFCARFLIAFGKLFLRCAHDTNDTNESTVPRIPTKPTISTKATIARFPRNAREAFSCKPLLTVESWKRWNRGADVKAPPAIRKKAARSHRPPCLFDFDGRPHCLPSAVSFKAKRSFWRDTWPLGPLPFPPAPGRRRTRQKKAS